MHVKSWGSLNPSPLESVSQVVNAKEKSLKETKSATPVNTQMISKWSSLISDMETVLVDRVED